MENNMEWPAIISLAVMILTSIIAAALMHGRLQQKVVELERGLASVETWRQSSGMQIAQITQIHADMAGLEQQLRSISTVLTELRVVIGRMEGWQDAREGRTVRRDTIPPSTTAP
jgi:hypothetical protein